MPYLAIREQERVRGRGAWLTRLPAERAHHKEGRGSQGGPLLAERAQKTYRFGK